MFQKTKEIKEINETPRNKMIISNISNIKPDNYNDILDILNIEIDISNVYSGLPFHQHYKWKPIRENHQTKEIISFLSDTLNMEKKDIKKATPVFKNNSDIRIFGVTDLVYNDSILFEIKKENTIKWKKFKIQAIVYLTLYTQKYKKPMKMVLTDLNEKWFYFYSEIDTKKQQCIIRQKNKFTFTYSSSLHCDVTIES